MCEGVNRLIRNHLGQVSSVAGELVDGSYASALTIVDVMLTDFFFLKVPQASPSAHPWLHSSTVLPHRIKRILHDRGIFYT